MFFTFLSFVHYFYLLLWKKKTQNTSQEEEEEEGEAGPDSPGRVPGGADPDGLQDAAGSELLHGPPGIEPAGSDNKQTNCHLPLSLHTI